MYLSRQTFFEWSERIHERFRPAITSGAKLTRSNDPVIDRDPLAITSGNQVFSDWGICFRRIKFPHFDQAVGQYREFDGYVHDVLLKHGDACISPLVPRVYHVGFYGQNRQQQSVSGTLDERIAEVRRSIEEKVFERPTSCGPFSFV